MVSSSQESCLQLAVQHGLHTAAGNNTHVAHGTATHQNYQSAWRFLRIESCLSYQLVIHYVFILLYYIYIIKMICQANCFFCITWKRFAKTYLDNKLFSWHFNICNHCFTQNWLYIYIYQLKILSWLKNVISIFNVKNMSHQYHCSTTFLPDYTHLEMGEGKKQTMQHARTEHFWTRTTGLLCISIISRCSGNLNTVTSLPQLLWQA